MSIEYDRKVEKGSSLFHQAQNVYDEANSVVYLKMFTDTDTRTHTHTHTYTHTHTHTYTHTHTNIYTLSLIEYS